MIDQPSVTWNSCEHVKQTVTDSRGWLFKLDLSKVYFPVTHVCSPS